jgi:DNA-binding Lrp family transcriptional regulator
VETEVRKLPDVRVLQSVSGTFDLIALAASASITQMDALIDAIGALDGVERTTSSIVLSTKFER